MTARPGVTPFAFSSAISRRRSTYTFSAIARPSISFGIVKRNPACDWPVRKKALVQAEVEWDPLAVSPNRRSCAAFKHSAHFNQRHHRVLQREAFGLKFVGCADRSYVVRLIDQHTHFGKGLRDDKAVPTSQAPATRIFEIHWQHWRAGFLCEKNDARAKLVRRAPRAIRGDDYIATRREHLRKLKNCARA